jgi:hypothetical protein
MPSSSEESPAKVTPINVTIKDDRRAELRAAAARVRGSMDPEFKQLGADELMTFLRGEKDTA